MLLLIDQGNTRAKFQFRDERGVICYSFSLKNSDSATETQLTLLENVTRTVVASVANSENKSWLTSLLQTVNPNSVIDFAVTGKSFDLGFKVVTNSYSEVSQMGVDRWLAAIAAANLCHNENCVVVDLGSAITIELVGFNGSHEGGYIIPGLNMMLRSLFANTAQVKIPQFSQNQDLRPGTNTMSCVGSGILNAVVGIVNRSIAQLESINPGKATRIILTGGDAGFIEGSIRMAEKEEGLIFEGLYLWQQTTLKGRDIY